MWDLYVGPWVRGVVKTFQKMNVYLLTKHGISSALIDTQSLSGTLCTSHVDRIVYTMVCKYVLTKTNLFF